MRPLLALLLLTPVLTGCLGGSDDALDSSAADAAGEVPTLPEGLEMEEAEVVSYNKTSVTWRWHGTTGPGLVEPVVEETPKEVRTFDVPAGLPLEISADITWSDEDQVLLLRVFDDEQRVRCFAGGTIPHDRAAACSVDVDPLDENARWELGVEDILNARPGGPFEVFLTLAVLHQAPAPSLPWSPCEHPWPCADGSEWPAGLEGPFDILGPQAIEVESHDGTLLRGFLYHPDLPDGVPAPTLVVSSPYYGTHITREFPRGIWGYGNIDAVVPEGYAVAIFSVRGSGISEGCFDNKGLDEQLDQLALVEWAAEQPWSNGRVAMAGTSYMGTTPWMAAIQAPEPLKAIIPIGSVTDPYTEIHTPQGAAYTFGGPAELERRGLVSLAPAVSATPQGHGPGAAVGHTTHACVGSADRLSKAMQGQATDDRDPAFWDERRLIDGFPDISAAVFLAHGLQEHVHPNQEDPVWGVLTQAPKTMLLGQWDHETPPRGNFNGSAIAWLDFWLKGIGGPPATLGTVGYEDGARGWHTSTAWPPAEALDEVHHLVRGELAPKPGPGGELRAAPVATREPLDILCGDHPGVPGDAPRALVFETGSIGDPVLLAGNPMAYLQLEADQPGGVLGIYLFALDPDDCRDSRHLSEGAADLRFHAGHLVGEDFPTGQPTWVRIDLENLAEPLQPGERLAVVLSHPEAMHATEPALAWADDRHARSGQPYQPLLTIHEGSHVVLPVVEGALGGEAPAMDYPPRPFVPEVGS